MSSGGIAQLTAVGIQDVHLTGEPQVSFFSSTFKRHTPFATTVERQVIQGNVTNGGMSTVRFERKGDLLGYTFLVPLVGSGTPEANVSITDWSTVIDSCELYIGGQQVDVQDSRFTQHVAPKVLASTFSKSYAANVYGGANTTSAFYPLRFTFCESWQTAIPLVATSFHDVEMRINWGSQAAASKWECYSAYVYLDSAERQMLQAKPFEQLVCQVQKSIASSAKTHELNFNHPVKVLAAANPSGVTLLNAQNKLKLQINGTDVTDYKFSRPHYTRIPAYYHLPFASMDTADEGELLVYPFCLESSRHQPTGSLNFSRLDSARVVSETQNSADDIYAVNYNILKYSNGLAALLYSN
jgi:hypothetical protein